MLTARDLLWLRDLLLDLGIVLGTPPPTQSDEHKAGSRLMYKMTCDAMSARDVTRLSVDQLTYLIPFVLTLPGTLGLTELKARCSTRVSEDGHVTRRMRWRTYAWGRTHAVCLVGRGDGWLDRLADHRAVPVHAEIPQPRLALVSQRT